MSERERESERAERVNTGSWECGGMIHWTAVSLAR